jgi:seryl-tRNA synthetase
LFYHSLFDSKIIVSTYIQKNREELLEHTKQELDNCTDKTNRVSIKEKLASIDDQLNKMLERKKELQEKENELSKTLGMGKLDPML